MKEDKVDSVFLYGPLENGIVWLTAQTNFIQDKERKAAFLLISIPFVFLFVRIQ